MTANDDYVRGKKRQRRKAPKTRSGCKTCKIRRVKCDETKPFCTKCTSTGRKCDGYIQDVSAQPLDPNLENDGGPSSISTSHPIAASFTAEATVTGHPSLRDHLNSYEPSNESIPLPLFPIGFPSGHLPGRAFHYFIHRSAIDLTGPLHSNVWREYILSVCATSPAIQYAVVALSGFHERYCFPNRASVGEECWRQYYLAVKSTNQLVDASTQDKWRTPTIKDEILISCLIFVTIEILLGNLEAALRHLEGGISLIKAYLTKGTMAFPMRSPDEEKYLLIGASIPEPELGPQSSDLVSLFARINLQVLSFSPKRHLTCLKWASPPKHHISQLSSLPHDPSSSLYRLMKHGLFWIRNNAAPFQYSPTIPHELYQEQRELLVTLKQWRTKFIASSEEDFSWIKERLEPPPGRAHLLLSYHLIYLKLASALSPSEIVYSSPECMRAFAAILCYNIVILRERTSKLDTIFLPNGERQASLFFSIESSVVDSLYFVATKCRQPVLRRCAVRLLRCAGREGVWSGPIMAKVAEHVIELEDGPRLDLSYFTELSLGGIGEGASGDSLMPQCDFWRLWEMMQGLGEKLLLGEHVEDMGTWDDEDRLVHQVLVDVDEEGTNVEVEFGWWNGQERTWRYEKNTLRLMIGRDVIYS